MMSKGYGYYVSNFLQIFVKHRFRGWGRKKTGRFASWCYHKFGGSIMLKEDGFIRSLGLGVEGSPSFSLVEDDVGIFYDATVPSKLENLLNTYDFEADVILMAQAREAMALVLKHNISKYNSAPNVDDDFCLKYALVEGEQSILVVAQTAGDASLAYGMLTPYTTDDLITAALVENPSAKVYVKVHPDVLSGKKSSDMNLEGLDKRCVIIDDDVNPLSLLKQFDKVYTKTSQMGFEALLVGCECVCFGMPFYAGWGVTDDRTSCKRRTVTRSVEEVFAAAYILYTRYYNPYKKRDCDIFEVIAELVERRALIKSF